MKKIILILAYILLTFTLLSCTRIDSSSKNHKVPGLLAKEKQTEIINCFITKDKEKLKSLFSKDTLSNNNKIDSKIDDAFNFIDGEIMSYNDPFGDAVGSPEKKSYNGKTTKIITERGTEYRIDFVGWLTYKNDTSKIGVEGIRIINITKMEKYSSDATEEELSDCLLKIGHFE